MIICYVSTVTHDNKNATTTHPVEVATFLSRLAEVHLVVEEYPGIPGGPSIHELGRQTFPPKTVWYSFKLLRLLDRLLGTVNVEIIYARQPGTAFLAYLVGKKHGVPVICEVNDLPEIGGYYGSKKTLSQRLMSTIAPLRSSLYLSIAARRVDHIRVVTEDIKRVLIERYKINPSKITVISNGANTDSFRPMNGSEAKRELNLSEEFQYVSFVGSLAYWQGLQNLIKSAPLVLQRLPDTRFLIVGDGPMKAELIEQAKQAGISDKVLFTGAVEYKQVPLYMNSGDVCVTPKVPLESGYSPLKLYEYMACGRPVVATRTDGFEVLEENNAGLLVNPENAEELAQAIIKLLEDPALRHQMGNNGRKYVVENRSWESIAKRVAGVCESVIKEHNRLHRKPVTSPKN